MRSTCHISLVDVERLIRDPPALHLDAEGNAVPWEASPRLLRALSASLFAGAKTLETGAGLSTLVFALSGCEHTVVVPDKAIADRILAWCKSHNVPTANLSFEIDRSEIVLPRLQPTPLDVVLIDGGHGFPIPFVDWHLAGQRVKPGGALFIDDTQIWTGAVLRDFLRAESGWDVVGETWLEFCMVRRTGSQLTGEFYRQPYVLHRSFTNTSSSAFRRLIGRLGEVASATRTATSLIREGDLRTLLRKIRAGASD